MLWDPGRQRLLHIETDPRGKAASVLNGWVGSAVKADLPRQQHPLHIWLCIASCPYMSKCIVFLSSSDITGLTHVYAQKELSSLKADCTGGHEQTGDDSLSACQTGGNCCGCIWHLHAVSMTCMHTVQCT